MTKNIIVSRHEGAIAWLKSKGYEGEVMAQLDLSKIEENDIVIGTLPIPLIKEVMRKKAHFILLSLPSIAFSERGKDLSPRDMEAAGASLKWIMQLATQEIGGRDVTTTLKTIRAGFARGN